jgi:phosphoribosylformimino-5-aminoimidazole carboxamide ribotide isomerase
MIVIPSFDLPHPDHPAPPASTATRDLVHEWEWMGFRRIQLVEPAPRGDRPLNRHGAEDILREAHVEVQVAGHIASADDVDALTAAGAAFVVVGTRGLDEPDWLHSVVDAFPDLLIVETTARERRIRTRGWVRTLPVDVRDLADELSDLRLAALMVAFPSDAAFDHADLALVEDLTEAVPYPVLVSGGQPTLAALRDLEFRGVGGVIIPSALLSASFDEQTIARAFGD